MSYYQILSMGNLKSDILRLIELFVQLSCISVFQDVSSFKSNLSLFRFCQKLPRKHSKLFANTPCIKGYEIKAGKLIK